MQAVTRATLFALALVALVLAAPPAAATTYVPVADERLLDRAGAVVEARVLAIESAPVSGTWPATDYLIEVSKVVAGEVPGRNLLVRLPGGTRPDGSLVQLYGIPRFGIGERVFLFLSPGDDGTFRVVHLMLGAFRERVVSGRRVLLRDLAGATALDVPGQPPAAQLLGPRDAEAFARWIADAARGVEREADYFLSDEEVRGVERVSGQFNLFVSDAGFNFRWFDFEEGRDVAFHMSPGGQPGYGEPATAAAAATAIAAWNGASGTNIRYRFAGTTTNNGVSVIQFENAGNQIDEDFDCGSGGVLAIGGPNGTGRVFPGPGGKSYHRITRGGIVLNTNIECLLQRTPNGLEQLLAHELGHTLGIHHPCGDGLKSCDLATPVEREALMYPFFHDDARGPRLNDDDRAAARSLYPGNTGGGGPAPAAPNGLSAAALSSSEVELSWSDNSDDETGFRIEARAAGGPWLLAATTGANATGTVVTGLEPATDYSFRVQSRRGTTRSSFSDEAQATTLPDAPLAPSSFAGETTSPTGVLLTWTDESSDELGFLVELRTPSSGAWVPVATLPPNTSSWASGPLLTGVPHSFRVSAIGTPASSPPTDPVSLTPQAPDAPCGGSPEVLCLGDRFRVTVDWNNPHPPGGFGTGKGAAFDGGESGTFWFFDPSNVELIVKVLDGTVLNGHVWVFHAALTDVEYWVSVLDTQTGGARTYYNPPLDRCGELDTAGIPGGDVAGSAVGPALVFPNATRAAGTDDATCGDDDTLCLLGGRFEVEVDWVNQHAGGETGVGHRVTGSDQTGYFWFFDSSNIELVVKVLDARAIGQGFWVFYGSLSDVEFSLTVTDTEANEQRSYFNAPGHRCGQFDTSAFPILGEPSIGER